MNIYSIYLVTNKINKKVYVGFTNNFVQRKREHKYAYVRKVTKFYTAIQKYGWLNFSWEIIYQSTDKQHCCNVMEPYFISEYDSCGRGSNGYNLTLGGEIGVGESNSIDWILTKPCGEEIHVNNLNKFCLENDLTTTNMIRVAKHGSKHHKGWVCRYADKEIRTPIYNFVCTDKNGVEFYVDKLETFCKERGLFGSGMRNVMVGNVKHYKGWTCRRFT